MTADELTQAELFALGGSACYAAVNLSDLPADLGLARHLRERAELLIKKSGLSPTELKNLGLRLVREAGATP